MAKGADTAKRLERLLESYERHYDIERDIVFAEERIPAKASFFSRGERYVLTRKAKIWAAECNEHVLFFTLPKLDMEALERIGSLLREAEARWVKPHEEHMYTHLTAVILAEEAEPAAVRTLRRYTLRKNYRFTFHGWCRGRIALLDLSDGRVTTNADGRELRRHLAKFAARP